MSDEGDWTSGTWEGSRRAQLRRSLALSVRERLEALERLSETSRRLAEIAGAEDDSGPAATRDDAATRVRKD